jgi:hypothetical protein
MREEPTLSEVEWVFLASLSHRHHVIFAINQRE